MTRRIIPPAPETPMRFSPLGERLCRQCGRPTGSLWKNFCDNPNCLYLWKCRRSPDFFKTECFRLFPRECASCGITHAQRIAKEFPNWKPGGFRCPPDVQWHADHHQPLWSGEEDDPEIVDPLRNGQLLCPKCHADKTAQEATERARQKRQGDANRVLALLRSPTLRLGATLKALGDASDLGQGLLRSCLDDLVAQNLAEQRKPRGPYYAVAPRASERTEREILHDAVLALFAQAEEPEESYEARRDSALRFLAQDA